MEDVEEIEMDLLLEAIHRKYGYDFKQYQKQSLLRRLRQHHRATFCNSISEMIPKVLHSREYFNGLLFELSVTVTEMFRDPELYKSLRSNVFSALRTYPFINIWHAGCATGQEAYSMAIMLKEEGLYHRSQIYATDINDRSLAIAKKGIFSIKEMRQYTENYNKSEGRFSLSDYYHTRYDSVKIDDSLRKNITFSRHNLVSDGVFAEMHVIFCKNVLIYFKKELQNKVLQLLADSLCFKGFLCLGDKESLEFMDVRNQFEVVDKNARIYQKKAPYKQSIYE